LAERTCDAGYEDEHVDDGKGLVWVCC